MAPESGAVLTGTVLDAVGQPVAGARVATVPHGYEATTGTDGAFRIDRLPAGTSTVRAAAPGAGEAEVADVALVTGETAEVTLTLEAAETDDGRLRVLVVGPDDLPLAGALVTSSTGEVATTDADGVAWLEEQAGLAVSLTVSDADGLLWARHLDDLAVPEVGGLQVSTRLSGRPPAGTGEVGSTFCGYCHADLARAWSASGHGGAAGTDPSADLRARFEAGEGVALDDGDAWLGTDGGDLVVSLEAADGERRTFPVVGFVGDPRRGTVPLASVGDEAWPLPVGWTGGRADRAGFPDAEPRLVPGDETPWFTSAGAFAFADTATPDPALSAQARCLPCHVSGYLLTVTGDEVGLEHDGAAGWREGAVGCERCHGPGEAHAMASAEERRWLITRPDRLDSDRGDAVCGQCHAGVESLDGGLPYPWSSAEGPFEPGRSLDDFATSDPVTWPSGAAAAPGQQLDEHRVSAHGQAGLRCIDCHDPHGESTDGTGAYLPALLRVDVRDNALCASCHQGLSFGGDPAAMESHPAHLSYPAHGGYDPSGPTEMGRCVGCHMPGTTARLAWGDGSGAGDRGSHLFVPLAPETTLAAFDAAGVDVLPPSEFPASACLDCHAWNAWRDTAGLGDFGGPTGDPTLRQTHERLQVAYEGKFPGGAR